MNVSPLPVRLVRRADRPTSEEEDTKIGSGRKPSRVTNPRSTGRVWQMTSYTIVHTFYCECSVLDIIIICTDNEVLILRKLTDIGLKSLVTTKTPSRNIPRPYQQAIPFLNEWMYICMCVCVCARACMHEYMCVCVRVRECVHEWMYVCMHAYMDTYVGPWNFLHLVAKTADLKTYFHCNRHNF
jgi:hypothetical protein